MSWLSVDRGMLAGKVLLGATDAVSDAAVDSAAGRYRRARPSPWATMRPAATHWLTQRCTVQVPSARQLTRRRLSGMSGFRAMMTPVAVREPRYLRNTIVTRA